VPSIRWKASIGGPELLRLEREHPNFRLLATMTRMGESPLPWAGETGKIEEALCSGSPRDCRTPSTTWPVRRPWSVRCAGRWSVPASTATTFAARSSTAT